MSEHEVRPSYFAIIPADVRYHTALSPNAKLLYGEITALADRNGYCWASNEYLATQFRWGERTVSRLVAQMKSLGLIRIEMVTTGKGTERRIYIGIDSAEGVAKIGDTPCSQNWLGGVAKTGDTHNMLNNTQNIPPYNPPKGGNAAKKRKSKSVPDWKPERFEKFWEFYRDNARGEDRAGAVREWDRLRPDDELIDTMAKALQAQVATDEWKRGVGIPYACRWLKNERWKDSLRGAASQETTAATQRRYIGTKVVDGEEVDVYE